MKMFGVAVLALWMVAVSPPAGGKTESDAAGAFEKLKTLVGEWEGKTAKGEPVRVSYKLVSAGTCLMETLNPAKDVDMVTMYHLDGNDLKMTHYCAANNQPRMQAEPASGEIKQLAFSFLDATNLTSPGEGHMHKLLIRFEDGDHFTQEWTWREGDKDAEPEVFHFTRKE